MQNLLLGAFVMLGIGMLLKIWNLGASMRWALAHGADYAAQAERRPPQDSQGRRRLLTDNQADFLPFGAKSIRLYGLRDSHPRLDTAFDVCYRNSPLFMLWVGLAVIVGDILASDSQACAVGCVVLSLVLVTYALGLLLEGVFWYVLAHNYTAVWGQIKSSKSMESLVGRGQALNDAIALGALTVAGAFSLCVAISSTQQHFGGFGDLPRDEGVVQEVFRLSDAAYYVLANLTTIGDSSLAPTTQLARLVSTFMMLCVLLVISLLISVVTSRLAAGDEPLRVRHRLLDRRRGVRRPNRRRRP